MKAIHVLALVAYALLVNLSALAQTDVVRSGRFSRGTGTNTSYQSFVIPLDLQKGLACSDSGGLADAYYPWNSSLFGSQYHYNATNPASATNLGLRLATTNPIAGFGSRVGGTPLYFGQQYRFGIYSGQIYPYYTNSVLIRTFLLTPTNSLYLGYAFIPLPSPYNTNDWNNYLTNGYEKVFTTNGLTTIVRFDQNAGRWGVNFGGQLTLTHVAAPSASNLVFQIGLAASTDKGDMVKTGAGAVDYCRMYDVEFESRPAWRSTFIDQPQFDGQPLPPEYEGQSLAQLLTNQAAVATTFSLPQAPNTYTNLDHSPELRRHPILDQFVSDMRRDPVALARYVHNEIDLTDAVSYNDNGSLMEVSVNPPGVSRGALAAFQEGQGGPAEQCALLVYLLRQAGTPAVYVYPPHNTLTMLDSRLSRLLRLQFRGAVNPLTGQSYTSNKLIAVNFPWVAAYVGTNWVHLFPWLKDTEIIEGFNLYDYTGTNYRNGFKWVSDYFYNKTNILSLASGDDTPAVLFPKFIQNQLSLTAPGLSLDDIGVRFLNRRKGYARWQDFPKPFGAPTSGVALDSLSSSAITNVFPALTNIFNLFQVEISSVVNTNKKVSTGFIRMVDLHNRRLLIRHEKTGVNTHNLILSLAAFRPGATGPTNFTTDDALLNLQQASLALDATDDQLLVGLSLLRHRSVTASYATNPPSPNYNYPGVYARTIVADQRQMRKGDLAAININAGRVSKRMLDVHAQELWNMERTLAANPSATNSISRDLYQGGTAFLTGMAYYENLARFREQNQELHKTHVMSQVAYGLSKLNAKRVAGALPNNGDIILVQPNVDMAFYDAAVAFNGSIHSESGAEQFDALDNFRVIDFAHGSAEEHQVMNFFYQQTDGISTVKLLQLAQKRKTNSIPGIFLLTPLNFTQIGDSNINGTLLKNHDASLWTQVTNYLTRADGTANQVFITPGAVTNSQNSYKGVGAFMWSPLGTFAVAAISPNQNGGFGNLVPDVTFDIGNSLNFTLRSDAAGNFYYDFNAPSTGNRQLANDNVAGYDLSQFVNYANADYFRTTLEQNQLTAQMVASGLLVQPGGTFSQQYGQAFQAQENQGWLGSLRNVGQQAWGLVADPVSSVTGEFYHDVADLVLPGPMPLTLRRNYSSHALADSPFGFGWKINYTPFLSLNTNASIIYAAEMDGAVLAYSKQTGTNLWLVTPLRNPLLDNHTKSGIGSAANRLRNRIVMTTGGGSDTYTLSGADGSVRTYQTAPFAGFSSTRPYLMKWQDNRGNFHAFEYGTDSTQPDYQQVRRILSSNGNLLGLRYDVYGHITEAYTADGRIVKYDYDPYGDMTGVLLPDATEIQFEYQRKTQAVTNGAVVTQVPYSTHLLLKELKPDGRVLINEYDTQRRVTNQWASVGPDLRPVRNATFLYTNNFNLTNSSTNGITGNTTVRDVFNNQTVYRYTNGLITNIVDALSINVRQIWWQPNETNSAGYYPRSLKRSIDRRGLITDFFYDTNGNVITNITRGDITGTGNTNEQAVTTTTYSTNNLPLETTDPATNKIRYAYHGEFAWLPEKIVRLAGATVTTSNLLVYYSVTNTVTNGLVVSTNFARGLVRQDIRASGSPEAAMSEWSHDGRGFPTQSIRYTGNTDPAVTLSLVHNSRGELVEQTDAAGRVTRFTYDGLGRRQTREVIGDYGFRLSWELNYYNGNGELTWSDGPRYDPEDYAWRDYDGAGRQTEEIRWRTEGKADGTGVRPGDGIYLFAQTFQEWDGFGNLKRVVGPRGGITTNVWDALGRLKQKRGLSATGATLTSEGFAYEPGNLVQFQTNALGGVTEFAYTTTGAKRFCKHADGSTNGWTYYLDGRPAKEILGNGSYWLSTYDDASRRSSRVFYSRANVALATNVTEVDRRGNVIRQVDAGGFAWTNLFDGLNRQKVSAGPAIISVPPTNLPAGAGGITSIVQQVSTTLYDAAGLVTTNINALGEKSVLYYDGLGRVIKSETYSGSTSVTGAPANTRIRLSTTSYGANHHGVTVTRGTYPNSYANTIYTDHDGQPVLDVGYPASNQREFTLYEYNRAGSLIAQTRYSATGAGSPYDWSFRYLYYDELERNIAVFDRDGADTILAYNAAGNLTNRVMPGGLNWRATYNNAGQVLKEYDIGTGNLASRTNTYSYYASSSPYAGLLQTRVDGRLVTCTRTYDDWLRPATNTYTGASNYHNLTTIERYDVRGLITNVTENFASTNTGPTVALRRSFNAYQQPTSELIYTNNVLFSSAQQAWDSAGRRRGLGYSSFGYGFGWRADGLLASSSGNTGGGTYGYNDAGLLDSRTLGSKGSAVVARDGTGRPFAHYSTISGFVQVNESLTFTGDGRIATHSLIRPDFTDNRAYLYADYSRRLIDERLNLDASKRWTNIFTYDKGQPAGPGVLTKVGQASSLSQWSSSADGLSRITTETNNVIRRLAYGKVNGPATISALLDGQPMPVTVLGTGNTTWTNQWRATLELSPGAHQLTAQARHPSGQFTTNATIWFTNSASAPDRIDVTYDLEGNVTKRLWRSANGTTNRTQTLSWDAKGRLYKVVERDTQTNGFDWTPVYDPLGRRFRTVEIPVTNNISLTAQAIVIDQFFDPQVRFMALGVSVSGKTTWRLMGPDLNGVYGGLQGRGGFDAIIPGPELFCPTISDARGNILAVYDQTHGTLSWNTSRATGYGAVAGYRPPPLGHGADLVQASTFAGLWSDVTGFYWRGHRYYDPIAGRWLSADPLGHDSDVSLFTYANGDPINWDDPDGLVAKDIYQNGLPGAQWLRSGANSLDSFSSQTDSGVLGAGAEFASYFMQMGAGLGTPSSFVNQSVADYNAGGVDNVINRYNPLRAPFQAGSGLNLMEGPSFGEQLSGVERTVDILNTLGMVASAGAGTLASLERSGLTVAAESGAANAVNAARLRTQLTAEEIAGGHAFDKHVIQGGEFPGITTRPQFSGQIEGVINNASDVRFLSNGRTAYWDSSSGTVVIRNPNAVDGGTAFKPVDGANYFYHTLK